MKRFIREFLGMNLLITGMISGIPLLVSLLFLSRENGYRLVLTVLGITGCIFLFRTWPCIGFVRMISRQERLGLPFKMKKLRRFSSDTTDTWLSEDWLIHAGYTALHRNRIFSIKDEKSTAGRGGCDHFIVIRTFEGNVYSWRMYENGIRAVRKWWMKGQKATSAKET